MEISITVGPPPYLWKSAFFPGSYFSRFSQFCCIKLDFYDFKGKVGLLNEYSQLITSSPASVRGLALNYARCFSLDFDSCAFLFSWKVRVFFLSKNVWKSGRPPPPPYGNFHKKITREFLKPSLSSFITNSGKINQCKTLKTLNILLLSLYYCQNLQPRNNI